LAALSDQILDEIALDRARGAYSFARFVKMAWPWVESNPLIWGWHLDAVCAHLEAVSRGQIRDLVISQPPGTSKSLLAATLWDAWDWINRPTLRTIAASYAQELTEKNARLLRDLVRGEWYQERWGDRVRIGKSDVDKVRFFKLESGGWRMATSVGGTVTGFHADKLLGDDLVKAQDAEGRAVIDPIAIEKANDFWFKTLHTRRADAARTSRVLIAQRLHHEDTPGKAIDAGYVSLVLPMEYDPKRSCVTVIGFKDPRTTPGELLCPDRFPPEVVASDKIALGPLGYEAQNQQDPTPQQGLLFKTAGDRRWTEKPPAGARTILTVDATFKDTKGSDFVSIQVWAVHGGRYYLLDNDTRRMGFGETCRAIVAMRDLWPQATGIYIEDKANGPAIIETLSAEVSGIVAWDPKSASKLSRAEAVAPLFEAGNVYLPADSLAPWIAAYLKELKKFPLTKHDDQVDATSMALLILHQAKHSRYASAIEKMKRGETA
jgi:predicted phage terminase large subunit-like protein